MLLSNLILLVSFCCKQTTNIMAGISWPNYRAILLSSIHSISTDSVLFPHCDHSLFKGKWPEMVVKRLFILSFSFRNRVLTWKCVAKIRGLKQEWFQIKSGLLWRVHGIFVWSFPAVCCPWFFKKDYGSIWHIHLMNFKKSSIINWNNASIPLCRLFLSVYFLQVGGVKAGFYASLINEMHI